MVRVLVVLSAASGRWQVLCILWGPFLRNHEPTPRCAMIKILTVLQKFLVVWGATQLAFALWVSW